MIMIIRPLQPAVLRRLLSAKANAIEPRAQVPGSWVATAKVAKTGADPKASAVPPSYASALTSKTWVKVNEFA